MLLSVCYRGIRRRGSRLTNAPSHSKGRPRKPPQLDPHITPYAPETARDTAEDTTPRGKSVRSWGSGAPPGQQPAVTSRQHRTNTRLNTEQLNRPCVDGLSHSVRATVTDCCHVHGAFLHTVRNLDDIRVPHRFAPPRRPLSTFAVRAATSVLQRHRLARRAPVKQSIDYQRATGRKPAESM